MLPLPRLVEVREGRPRVRWPQLVALHLIFFTIVLVGWLLGSYLLILKWNPMTVLMPFIYATLFAGQQVGEAWKAATTKKVADPELPE